MIPRRVWLLSAAVTMLVISATPGLERSTLDEVWRRAVLKGHPTSDVQLFTPYENDWERRLAAIEGSIKAKELISVDDFVTGSITVAE